MKKPKRFDDWRNWPMSMAFDSDFAAWIKSLSRKARVGEPAMQWSDLGPLAHTAYQLHYDLASAYQVKLLKDKIKKTPVLPDDATPEGFYRVAVECRRRQVGEKALVVDTPWHRLSAYSQFLYRRMAERIAQCAGHFGKPTTESDDGLGDDLDDGLGGDGLGDDLDDGLGGLSDDGLGDIDDDLDDGL